MNDRTTLLQPKLLLPAVHNATPETLVVTDGYSCRVQIAQTTCHKGCIQPK